MKPNEFFKASGRSLASFAQEWGISTSTLSRAVKGERWPSTLVLVRVHEVSNGSVGLTDWIETCRPLLVADGVIKTEGNADGLRETIGDGAADAPARAPAEG